MLQHHSGKKKNPNMVNPPGGPRITYTSPSFLMSSEHVTQAGTTMRAESRTSATAHTKSSGSLPTHVCVIHREKFESPRCSREQRTSEMCHNFMFYAESWRSVPGQRSARVSIRADTFSDREKKPASSAPAPQPPRSRTYL